MGEYSREFEDQKIEANSGFLEMISKIEIKLSTEIQTPLDRQKEILIGSL